MRITHQRVIACLLAVMLIITTMPVYPSAYAASGLTCSTLSAKSIGTTSATLRGEVNTNGGYEIEEYWFAFREKGGSWEWIGGDTGHIDSGKTITHEVTDLDPYTTYEYEFQVRSSNSDLGTAYGGVKSFTTDCDCEYRSEVEKVGYEEEDYTKHSYRQLIGSAPSRSTRAVCIWVTTSVSEALLTAATMRSPASASASSRTVATMV